MARTPVLFVAGTDWTEEDRGFSTPCWIWQRHIDRHGYGRVYNGLAHRAVYERKRGPIPEGLGLDHLCRVPACVNPDHLEPVTQQVNLQRGDVGGHAQRARTHCPQGHPYDEENTYRYTHKGSDRRGCRICRRNARRRYAARIKND